MTTIAIESIRRDGGTQPRDHINMEVVREYAEAIASGAQFPPVSIFYDGSDYWLADGFHRAIAHETLGLAVVEADIRSGSCRDAILFSVGANSTHGYRRTNADKRRSVLILFGDTEWREWSDHEIARRCRVSQPFVSKLRPAVDTDNGYQSEPRKFKHGKTGKTTSMKARKAKPKKNKSTPPPENETKEPQPSHDWASANLRNRAMEAIKTIAECPPPAEVLAAWAKSDGYGVPPETISAAAQWLAEFSRTYPEVEARRLARVESMIERTQNVA